jgi:hypothetical protein
MPEPRTMCVHRMGTNECESLFAELGHMVGKHRVYSYMVRT